MVVESVVSKMVCVKFLIIFPNTVTHVELLELEMFDFDVLLVMDRFHACFASVDWRTLVVKFNFQNDPVLELKGEILFIKVLSFLV